MPLLLDTCTLLWLSRDPSELSPKAKQTIEDHENDLFISAIAALEVSMLVRKRRLALPPSLSAEDWFRETLKHHGIEQVPLNFQIASKSDALPEIHKDPMDRLMIATAQEYKMTILTPDQTIHQYPDIECLW